MPQHSAEHLPDLFPAHWALFDQADHHPHMLDQLWILRLGQSLGQLGRTGSPGRFGWGPRRRVTVQDFDLASLPLVLAPLVLPPLFALVISGAAPGGLFATMGLPAPKGTTQIVATSVAGMREEKNPAMPATAQASAKARLGAQGRSQEYIKLRDQRGNRSLSIPARPKLEKLRDPYCKKPKLSLKVLR